MWWVPFVSLIKIFPSRPSIVGQHPSYKNMTPLLLLPLLPPAINVIMQSIDLCSNYCHCPVRYRLDNTYVYGRERGE